MLLLPTPFLLKNSKASSVSQARSKSVSYLKKFRVYIMHPRAGDKVDDKEEILYDLFNTAKKYGKVIETKPKNSKAKSMPVF